MYIYVFKSMNIYTYIRQSVSRGVIQCVCVSLSQAALGSDIETNSKTMQMFGHISRNSNKLQFHIGFQKAICPGIAKACLGSTLVVLSFVLGWF